MWSNVQIGWRKRRRRKETKIPSLFFSFLFFFCNTQFWSLFSSMEFTRSLEESRRVVDHVRMFKRWPSSRSNLHQSCRFDLEAVYYKCIIRWKLMTAHLLQGKILWCALPLLTVDDSAVQSSWSHAPFHMCSVLYTHAPRYLSGDTPLSSPSPPLPEPYRVRKLSRVRVLTAQKEERTKKRKRKRKLLPAGFLVRGRYFPLSTTLLDIFAWHYLLLLDKADCSVHIFLSPTIQIITRHTGEL